GERASGRELGGRAGETCLAEGRAVLVEAASAVVAGVVARVGDRLAGVVGGVRPDARVVAAVLPLRGVAGHVVDPAVPSCAGLLRPDGDGLVVGRGGVGVAARVRVAVGAVGDVEGVAVGVEPGAGTAARAEPLAVVVVAQAGRDGPAPDLAAEPFVRPAAIG